MAVAAKAFQHWRATVAPHESTTDLCRMTGIKRSTLAQQLVRNKVSMATVIRVARAYGQDPVTALSSFTEFAGLDQGRREPTQAELISQVSYPCILKALLDRATATEGAKIREPELCDYPHTSSVRQWFDAIDPGDLRQQLSTVTGTAPQNISAQLTAGRLAPELAIAAARIAGVSLTSGLVVTGVLQPEEGGWPPKGREKAIAELSDVDLVILARDRLDALSKVLRKREQDEKFDQALLENLG
ncbi:hypothetical protein [Arthrobacter sp.]|uniref:hypothetical protein n=1 Tax=Arthrobacter sp. TaxID=1667 RepID=UPI002898FD4D|nr:hypothetical protein [Arthrobacter sp.]